MEDLLKKLLYSGVGFAANTLERAKSELDEMVEKGKLSEEEGKKMVDELLKNAESKKGELEVKLRGAVESVMEKLNLPSLDYVEKLEKRVKSLEVKVGLLSKELDGKNAKAKTKELA